MDMVSIADNRRYSSTSALGAGSMLDTVSVRRKEALLQHRLQTLASARTKRFAAQPAGCVHTQHIAPSPPPPPPPPPPRAPPPPSPTHHPLTSPYLHLCTPPSDPKWQLDPPPLHACKGMRAACCLPVKTCWTCLATQKDQVCG